MKTYQQLLTWILCALVGLQILGTMLVFPEFRVTPDDKFQEIQKKISTLDSEPFVLQTEVVKGRTNGELGQNLAMRTLGFNCLILLLLIVMLVNSHRKKNV